MVRELHYIIERQQPEKKGEKRKALSGDDRKFLWNFALNSNLMREEFGEKKDVGIFDPEAEIQRIMSLVKEACKKQVNINKPDRTLKNPKKIL